MNGHWGVGPHGSAFQMRGIGAQDLVRPGVAQVLTKALMIVSDCDRSQWFYVRHIFSMQPRVAWACGPPLPPQMQLMQPPISG